MYTSKSVIQTDTALGVPVVTVSKALRSHNDISEATREQSLERFEELDCTLSLAARDLVTGKACLVGLLVYPDLLHLSLFLVARSLLRALLKKGYHHTISTSEEDEINRLLSRPLRALGVAPASANPSAFKSIEFERFTSSRLSLSL